MRSALHNRFPTYDVRGSYPDVYFADLEPSDSQNCAAQAARPHTTLSASKSVFEVAIHSAQFLNHESANHHTAQRESHL